MKISNTLLLLILACLTLGLAPFSPEPHLYGKLKWILGGAKGMKTMDWADFLLHSLPWILIIGYLIKKKVNLH